jgi:hypothetical protein
MADAISAKGIAEETEDARVLFRRLQSGNKFGFSTAKEMSDRIRDTLKDIGKDLSVLDPEPNPSLRKTHGEMDKILQSTTVDLQVKDVRKDFERLKSGDITVSPAYMADYIRKDLKDVGKELSALDPKGKKTADEMDEELKKVTTDQQIKIIQNLFKRLKDGDTGGYKKAERMGDAIRKELGEIGKDLSSLDPKHKKSADEMGKELEQAVAAQQEKEQQLEKAKILFEKLNQKEKLAPYPHPEIIEKHIRLLLEASGKPLSAIGEGEQTNSQIDKALKEAVINEKARGKVTVELPSVPQKQGNQSIER